MVVEAVAGAVDQEQVDHEKICKIENTGFILEIFVIDVVILIKRRQITVEIVGINYI